VCGLANLVGFVALLLVSAQIKLLTADDPFLMTTNCAGRGGCLLIRNFDGHKTGAMRVFLLRPVQAT
jgi:hypothetical protein